MKKLETMEFKGTKGKWKIKISPVTNGWVDVEYPDGYATVRTQDYISNDKDCGNKKLLKNTIVHAKLIAAAPLLLKELKRMTLSMQAHPDCEPNSEFQDYVNSAWEAIEKATK